MTALPGSGGALGRQLFLHVLLALPLLRSARPAPDLAELLSACYFSYALRLDLPESNHHTIRAADFQRRAWAFYSDEPASAPLEEAYWVLALPTEFQETIAKECPALVSMSYLLVAETKLYLDPPNA